MITSPNILIAGADPKLHEEIEAALSGLGIEQPILHAASDLRQAVEAARSRRPDLGLVEMTRDLRLLKTFTEEVRIGSPETVVAALFRPDVFGYEVSESAVLIEALRYGVRDFLRRPVSSHDLGQLLTRLSDARAAGDRSMGKIISMVSNKGGVGKSTLAVNLARGLAKKHPEQVLLVDLSLQMGVCASMLNLTPTLSIADAWRQRDRLDETLLRQLATVHPSGLHLLASPASAADATEIDDELVSRVLTLGRRAYEFVIVDTFPMLDRVVMSALDLSDRVYIVLENVVPTLQSGVRLIELLDGMSYDRARQRVVLNRYATGAGNLRAADIALQLRRDVNHVIPFDRQAVLAANTGRPFVETAGRFSRLGRSIRELVREVDAMAPGTRPPPQVNGQAVGRNFVMSNDRDVEKTSEIGFESAQRSRELFSRTALGLPATRLRSNKPKPREEARSEPEPVVVGRGSEYHSIKGELHQRLLDELEQRKLLTAREDQLTEAVEEFVARVLATETLPLNDTERKRLVEDLLEETLGVGPLAPLLADPAVTDILVNGPNQVYVERFGRLELTDVRFRNADHLIRIIQRIAARIGRRIDEASPMVDARLPDGSRVNATVPPVTIDGPTLSIRRFGRTRLRREDLMRLGMLSPEMTLFLELAVKARTNILIAGGTGAGKSTFLGAMAEAIPQSDRIVTIEDAAELILDQTHVVRMETRPANVEGMGRITARDLVINSLRMRPDRIIVGEVRGGEALDMMQAMNTGHDGSMTTIHANTPRDALARLETMVLMAGLELPSRAIREQIVSAIQLVVQVRRFDDGVRRVESIIEITGLEGLTPQTQEIFRFVRGPRRGRLISGEFAPTGVVPRLVQSLREKDFEIPMAMFQTGRAQQTGENSG